MTRLTRTTFNGNADFSRTGGAPSSTVDNTQANNQPLPLTTTNDNNVSQVETPSSTGNPRPKRPVKIRVSVFTPDDDDDEIYEQADLKFTLSEPDSYAKLVEAFQYAGPSELSGFAILRENMEDDHVRTTTSQLKSEAAYAKLLPVVNDTEVKYNVDSDGDPVYEIVDDDDDYVGPTQGGYQPFVGGQTQGVVTLSQVSDNFQNLQISKDTGPVYPTPNVPSGMLPPVYGEIPDLSNEQPFGASSATFPYGGNPSQSYNQPRRSDMNARNPPSANWDGQPTAPFRSRGDRGTSAQAPSSTTRQLNAFGEPNRPSAQSMHDFM
ncbi:hypothetical protein M231_02753 [Tremella mesenterica]|uniref:Uncharacterized protein n=1 Tax=Tremella mesenterica TaxID=5217 RepID=A0A4Q1BPX2_TREME|nr:uncharacterized protein TREMEDRAFT_62009 [Tremella mesenterica DSM 1558]EIW70247.1 hypothetical protein TREMEDRAFT_62009 [Tremella mesenterica DSM 1558]RXK39958.1 hypothetical protein M231_02753 [Tremella mesenterica]